MSNCFRHEANITTSDIDLDIVAESFPVVLSGDKFLRFLDAEVAC